MSPAVTSDPAALFGVDDVEPGRCDAYALLLGVRAAVVGASVPL